MKKQPPRIELNPREPATPGTIGWVFDRYRNSGKLPDNLIININNFKSSKMSENKINTGAIFKNKNKTAENHPDYRGVLNANGKDMDIALWLRESKSGVKYFSVMLSEPYQKDTQASGDKSFKPQDDDLPF